MFKQLSILVIRVTLVFTSLVGAESPNRFPHELDRALRGMTYPSEGDYQPLHRVMDINLSAYGVVEAYDTFIARRVQYGPDRRAYARLDRLMRANCTDLSAVTVGNIQVAIFVMGTCHGQRIGWMTTAIET